MSTSSGSTSTPSGTQPKQQIIAVALLLVCLILGGAMVYWLAFSGSLGSNVHKVVLKSTVDATGGGRAAAMARRSAIGITASDKGSWLVRAHKGGMGVYSDSGGGFQFRYFFTNSGLSRADVLLLSALIRIQHDPAMARQWKVTSAQHARLRSIGTPQMRLTATPAQHAAMKPLWDAYLKASTGAGGDKSATEKAVVDELDQIASQNIDAERQSVRSQLETAKAVFTGEQLAMIMK